MTAHLQGAEPPHVRIIIADEPLDPRLVGVERDLGMGQAHATEVRPRRSSANASDNRAIEGLGMPGKRGSSTIAP
jgi:hypothetical protein